MNVKNVLKETTVVNGFFNGVEIVFAVGDCQRTKDSIKVNNIRKVDDEHKDDVPSTLSLSDKRLNILSIPKSHIYDYFNVGRIAQISTGKVNKDHKKQEPIKKDFSHRSRVRA